jgi:gluconolactonase
MTLRNGLRAISTAWLRIWLLMVVGASSASAAGLADICSECRFEKVVTCGQFLEGINFDKAGHIWAVSLFSGDVIEVVGDKCETRIKTGGHANGARFNKDGRLFITDNVRGVIAFDPGTKKLEVIADKIAGQPMVAANDLVFDETGGFYVTVPGASNFLNPTGQVAYFAAGSSVARVIADHLPYPNGVALAPDGKFVTIGLYDAKTIITLPAVTNIESKRGPFVFAHTEGGIGPDGMTMDADGRLYWANFLSGAVGIADADGFLLGYAKLPSGAGHWTTNVAFRDGYLYVTEAEQGVVWRMPVKVQGELLYADK